jgi:hypothetical protein
MAAYGGRESKARCILYMKASGQFNGSALFPYETAYGRINGQKTDWAPMPTSTWRKVKVELSLCLNN